MLTCSKISVLGSIMLARQHNTWLHIQIVNNSFILEHFLYYLVLSFLVYLVAPVEPEPVQQGS